MSSHILSLEEIQGRLDKHFRLVERLVLSKQNHHTGLLPASTEINAHGNYTDAWVRDNVYSILCVGGLALCYRKVPVGDRAWQLETATVRCMRGLLNAMMKQAPKVEKFKFTQHRLDSLHAKYDTPSGNTVVADDQWGHLQLDATSLFVFYVAQMTASGLRIIQNADEVNFMQNLVYYIELAYCTPDYGLWERGNKRNTGETELNSSSIGIAKAAQEAIDGLDLFHTDATVNTGAYSRVFAFQDEIARAREHLLSYLPQESVSKEVDAALLSVIGFPCFAVSDARAREVTRQTIESKLEGRYGCKRFLRDGHQCSHEDHSRLHYEEWELKKFENTECEWPLFFTYMFVEALFTGDAETASRYRDTLLNRCAVDRDGYKMIPELYIVKNEDLDRERGNPKTVDRVPNANIPLIWAQSLFLIGEMIWDGVLTPKDLDPLDRRLGAKQIRGAHSVVRVFTVAEGAELKAQMQQTLGADFPVLTPSECEAAGLSLRHPTELVRVFQGYGESHHLGVSGRPPRKVGPLATARVYAFPPPPEDGSSNAGERQSQRRGQTVLFVPEILDRDDFYMMHDEEVFVKTLRDTLLHISANWRENRNSRQPSRPVFCLYVTAETFQFKTFLGFLKQQWKAQVTAAAAADQANLPTSPAFAESVPPQPPPASLGHADVKFSHLKLSELGEQAGKQNEKETLNSIPEDAEEQVDPFADYFRTGAVKLPVKLVDVQELMQLPVDVSVGYIRRLFLFQEAAVEDKTAGPVMLLPSKAAEQSASKSKVTRVESGTLLDKLPEVAEDMQQLEVFESLLASEGLESTQTGISVEGREGPVKLRDLVLQLFDRSVRSHSWAVARRAAAVLEMHPDALGDAVSWLLLADVHLTIGMSYENDVEWDRVTSEILHSNSVAEKIRGACSEGGEEGKFKQKQSLEATMVMEILQHLGAFARGTNLLANVPRLRLGLLLRHLWQSRESEQNQIRGRDATGLDLANAAGVVLPGATPPTEQYPLKRKSSLMRLPGAELKNSTLVSMAPSGVRKAIKVALTTDPKCDYIEKGLREVSERPQIVNEELRESYDWQVLRELHGVLSRNPVDLACRVWRLMNSKKATLKIGGKTFRHELCLEMTEEEKQFEAALNEFLGNIRKAEFRQCVVELLAYLYSKHAKDQKDETPKEVELDKMIVQTKDAAVSALQSSDPAFYQFASEEEAWRTFYAVDPASMQALFQKQNFRV